MRGLALLLALTMPFQPTAGLAAAGGVVTICTARGARVVRIDSEGKPIPERSAPGCAHLWCDMSRSRSRTRRAPLGGS